MVKHYEVQLEIDGAWTIVASHDQQSQRRAAHELAQVAHCTALRVRVLATWGLPAARIVRISAYS